jgi:hypothetical protein
MSKDLREYARSTQTRLIAGFLLLVFIVGDGLIFILYGQGAGLAGLICLLGALLPIGLIVFFLWLADRIVEKQG